MSKNLWRLHNERALRIIQQIVCILLHNTAKLSLSQLFISSYQFKMTKEDKFVTRVTNAKKTKMNNHYHYQKV